MVAFKLGVQTEDRKWNVLHAAVKIYDVEFVPRVSCYGLVLDTCVALLGRWCKFPFRYFKTRNSRWYLVFWSVWQRRRKFWGLRYLVKLLLRVDLGLILKRWFQGELKFPWKGHGVFKTSCSCPSINVLGSISVWAAHVTILLFATLFSRRRS